MELPFQLQSRPENPKAMWWESYWGMAVQSKPPEFQRTAKWIPLPLFQIYVILHCQKLGCGEDLQLPHAISCMAFHPNCLYGQDLDQHVSHLKNMKCTDLLPTLADKNTNSSPLVDWVKTRLYSWWRICRKAKVIKWCSTELRSLSKIKMECTCQLPATVTQENSLSGDSHKYYFTQTLLTDNLFYILGTDIQTSLQNEVLDYIIYAKFRLNNMSSVERY